MNQQVSAFYAAVSAIARFIEQTAQAGGAHNKENIAERTDAPINREEEQAYGNQS